MKWFFVADCGELIWWELWWAGTIDHDKTWIRVMKTDPKGAERLQIHFWVDTHRWRSQSQFRLNCNFIQSYHARLYIWNSLFWSKAPKLQPLSSRYGHGVKVTIIVSVLSLLFQILLHTGRNVWCTETDFLVSFSKNSKAIDHTLFLL